MYARQNEMRDLNCSLLEMAGLRQIIPEPIIFESAEEQLQVDCMVQGFEHPQKVSMFDCCIVNADSPSLEHLSLDAIFTVRKNVKERSLFRSCKSKVCIFHTHSCHLLCSFQ